MIYLVLLLALGLRLINLNQSLWLDEAVQAITAQSTFGYIFQEILGDFHPPLYHFLMHFWVRIFGSSEIALRMPSVLFGAGAVFFVYKIAEKLSAVSYQRSADKETPVTGNQSLITKHLSLATIAALFMATAPFHIYYSQEARMYSMTTFFVALSMYLFMRVISGQLSVTRKEKPVIDNRSPITNNSSLVTGYFISTALLIYSDYFGFLVLAAQFLIVLLKKRYKFLLTYFLLLITFFPWFPMFIKQLQTGLTATSVLPEWGRLVNLSFIKALPLTFIKFSIGRITIFNKIQYLIVFCLIFVIYGFVVLRGFSYQLSVTGYWLLGKSEKKNLLADNCSLITIFAWLTVPLALAWGISLFVPNYQPFRLLLVLPAFYLLLSLGISSIKSKKIQGLAVGFVLVVNLASLSRYYFNPYFQREDWKGLTQYLKNQKNDSLIILPSETSSWPVQYYDPDNKITLTYGSKGINKVGNDGKTVIGDQLSVTGRDKVYYVRYLVPLFDPEEKILAGLEQKGYTKMKEINFNQIEVWEHERSYR